VELSAPGPLGHPQPLRFQQTSKGGCGGGHRKYALKVGASIIENADKYLLPE